MYLVVKSEVNYSPEIGVLFSEQDISQRINLIAKDISHSDLNDIVVIVILSGSFIFAADLIRSLHQHNICPEVDFITLASYHGETKSSGTVKILRDITRSIEGRNVLIVDDILDTGRTLKYAKELIKGRAASCVSTCVLLDKPDNRVVEVEADFIGFKCPDVFVVGYGMDFNHRLRELPFIGRIM